MATRLRPCARCRRHVRASARACPFCDGTTRFATALGALALAACGAATGLPIEEPRDGEASDAANADEPDAFDDDGGIVFLDSSLPDSSSFDAQFERGTPVYGAPPRRPNGR